MAGMSTFTKLNKALRAARLRHNNLNAPSPATSSHINRWGSLEPCLMPHDGGVSHLPRVLRAGNESE
jgi:hypothetical protein